MAIGDIIVGVDIGTSKVCTVVGEVNNFGQIEIICNTSYKCNGLKKGKIINEDEIILSLAKTIKDAEDETNLKINSAYVTIPGKYVTIVQNSITKEVKDKYAGISIRDVQNAIMQVKDIEIPDGQTLIDIVPDKITLDNGTVVTDPVGKLSSNFTISAQVILAEKDYVRQLNSIFKKSGLDIDGIVPITLAERNLVLDTNELHDNIMLLDIGAGNTDCGKREEIYLERTALLDDFSGRVYEYQGPDSPLYEFKGNLVRFERIRELTGFWLIGSFVSVGVLLCILYVKKGKTDAI